MLAAAILGYVVGTLEPPAQQERLSGSTLLSCEALPPLLILKLSNLDRTQMVQVALAVGDAEYFITPDRPLVHGLAVARGLRPDAAGRIEMVRLLDFSPPDGPAEYVVYKAGSLSDEVERQRLPRLACAQT